MGFAYFSKKHLSRNVDLYFNFHEIQSMIFVIYIFLAKSLVA